MAGEPGNEEFWGKASDKARSERDRSARPRDPDAEAAAKKRRRRRWLIGIPAGLLGLLGLGVVFAPQIGSSFAPGIIKGQSGKAIPGGLEVKSVSLSWGGPQRIEDLQISDPKGKVVARLTLSADAGLWGLINGALDLGNVTIQNGRADIVRDDKGVTNLERALVRQKKDAGGGGTPKESSPASIPPELRAKVNIKNLNITFEDLSNVNAPPVAVSLKGADLSANVAPGDTLRFTLKGEAFAGKGDKTMTPPRGAQVGTIDVSARIDKWSSASGRLTLDKATGEATVKATGLPLEIIDAFAPGLIEGGTLASALGGRLDASLTASGDADAQRARFTIDTQGVKAAGAAAYDGKALTGDGPISVSASGAAIRALAPQAIKALEESGARLDAVPDLDLKVENLRVPFAPGQSEMDLRGTRAALTVALSRASGTVTLPEQAAKPFTLSPATLTATTEDLAGQVALAVKTTATFDGAPAGDVDVNLNVRGLLKESGAIAGGMPSSIAGTANIRNISTALAQTFAGPALKDTPLDLPRDIGPTLDVVLTASAEPPATPGAPPPTRVVLNVNSANLTASAEGRMARGFITTDGEGVKFELRNATALLPRFVPESSGYVVRPMKEAQFASIPLNLRLTNVMLPLREGGGVNFEKVTARMDMTFGGVEIEPIAQAPGVTKVPPVNMGKSPIRIEVLEGGSPTVQAQLWLGQGGAAFGVKSQMTLRGLLAGDAAGGLKLNLEETRPIGTLEIKDAPVALLGMLPAKPTETPAEGAAEGAAAEPAAPLDLVKLARSVLGPTVTVNLESKTPENAAQLADVTLSTRAERFTLDSSAKLSRTALDVGAVTATTTLSPQTVAGLFDTFKMETADLPRLSGPAKIEIESQPMRLPLAEGLKPVPERAGKFAVRVRSPGRTMVEGLVVKNEDGTTRDLGRVGVDNLDLRLSATLGSLLAPALAGEKEARVSVAGTLIGNDDRAIGVLDGSLLAEVSSGKAAGPLALNVKLRELNTGAVERLINQEGLLSGALGASAALELSADVQPPPNKPEFDLAAATINAGLVITAPQVQTSGPIRVVIDPAAIRITEPARLTATLTPAFLNRFLTPADGAAPSMRLADQTTVSLDIPKFVMPREGSATRLEANSTITMPAVRLFAADGKPISFEQVRLAAQTVTAARNQNPGSDTPLVFELAIGSAKVADAPSAENSKLTGDIRGLVDAAGNFTTQRALLNASGDLPAIPTLLVDAFTNQQGLLVDALGPTVALKVTARDVPIAGADALTKRGGGVSSFVSIDVVSPRADASLRGTLADGRFVGDGPVTINIREVTKELAGRFLPKPPEERRGGALAMGGGGRLELLPWFESLVKTKEDQPGVIQATGVTAPLDGDLSNLNAVVKFDPGVLRYEMRSGIFGTILKDFDVFQKQKDVIGNKLEPLTVTIKSGVATYEPWTIPLGNFTISTYGVVNLSNVSASARVADRGVNVPAGHMHMVIRLPLFAVADSVMSNFGASLPRLSGPLSSLLDRNTSVPFVADGPLASPKTGLDAEVFAKEALRNLGPDKILGDPKKLLDLLGPDGLKLPELPRISPKAPTPPTSLPGKP